MKKLITILTTSIFAMLMAAANVFAYKVGDIIEFGSYPYEANGTERPIEWIILEISSEGMATVLSKYGLEAKPYNENWQDTTWETSSIRNWLNKDFYSIAFSTTEKKAIREISSENYDNVGEYNQDLLNNMLKWDNSEEDKEAARELKGVKWHTFGGNTTRDKVWMLSLKDITHYSKFFNANYNRMARATPYAIKKGAILPCLKYYSNGLCKQNGVSDFDNIIWWLRSPGRIQASAAFIYIDGYVRNDGLLAGSPDLALIRPALYLSLDELEINKQKKSNNYPESILFPFARRRNPDAIAVIIGAKNYDSNISAVEYAHNDASAIKDFAIRTLGYDPENIIYETDPTKGRLEQIFGTKDSHEGMLYNWIKPGKSDVLVYYTGHGAPDQKTKSAYFVPKDANPDYIKIGGYSMETLYANLAKMPAKSITVITDACFSGQGGNGKMIIKSASPLAITAKIPVANNGTNSKMTVFNAGKGDEMASWYDAKQHSLFTYYFLLGMSGQADTNNDKTITAGELDDYLQENVPYRARRMYNREQHPVFTGNRNAPLVTYK